MKINGKDGTVNELTNKTWDPNNFTSGQAATEDQLKAVDQKITNTSEELTKKAWTLPVMKANSTGTWERKSPSKAKGPKLPRILR